MPIRSFSSEGDKLDYKLVEFVENGLKVVVGMKGNKRHGPITKYYANGNKMFEAGFFEGLPDGKTVSYYENGNVWRESWYILGERTGTEYVYNEQGKMEQKEVYDKGQLVSKDTIETKREYYENKTLKIERDFLGGEIVNERFYDRKGRIYREVRSVIGENGHTEIIYRSDGTIRKVFNNSGVQGMSIDYDVDGKKESQLWKDKETGIYYSELYNSEEVLIKRFEFKEAIILNVQSFDGDGKEVINFAN